jgi:hypothetical protein
MATAKQTQNTSTDQGSDTVTTDTPSTETANTIVPTALPEALVPDFSTSDTWGQGGRYVVNEQGQRVLAPGN